MVTNSRETRSKSVVRDQPRVSADARRCRESGAASQLEETRDTPTMNDNSGSSHGQQPTDDDRPFLGFFYATLGIAAVVVGGLLLENAPINDYEDVTRSTGLALLGIGAFLIVVGAVARGVRLGRREGSSWL